jgi:hypothetical protein
LPFPRPILKFERPTPFLGCTERSVRELMKTRPELGLIDQRGPKR